MIVHVFGTSLPSSNVNSYIPVSIKPFPTQTVKPLFIIVNVMSNYNGKVVVIPITKSLTILAWALILVILVATVELAF